MRARTISIGIALTASLMVAAPGLGAVSVPRCVVVNPGSTSCTVIYSPPVRDVAWAVLAPHGTWSICFTETTDPNPFCLYSWQLPSRVPFYDTATTASRFTSATLQVLGAKVDGRREGIGLLTTEPVRPLCLPYLHHQTFCV